MGLSLTAQKAKHVVEGTFIAVELWNKVRQKIERARDLRLQGAKVFVLDGLGSREYAPASDMEFDSWVRKKIDEHITLRFELNGVVSQISSQIKE